jgi:hypothetical protein
MRFVETGLGSTAETVEAYQLAQNYPNPFNPTTTIRFSLREAGTVSLKIYDVVGREVRTVVDGRDFGEGSHEIQFRADDLASGVYFYRIMTSDQKFSDVRTMTILK